VLCEPAQFGALSDALTAAHIKTENGEITMIPDSYMPVTDKTQAAALVRFVNALEELDDVQNVYANFDIPDDIMEAVSG
jgi:transcriptional/translational regulatory protein YebC/TACO1